MWEKAAAGKSSLINIHNFIAVCTLAARLSATVIYLLPSPHMPRWPWPFVCREESSQTSAICMVEPSPLVSYCSHIHACRTHDYR